MPPSGRLLQVEDQRLPARGDADRHPEEPGAGARRHPAGVDRAEQVEQAHRAGGVRGRRPPLEPARGQVPGQGLADGEVGRVGPDAADQAAVRCRLLEGGPAVVVQAEAHRQLGRLAGHGLGEPDGRAAGRGGAVEQLVGRCRLDGGAGHRRGVGARRRIDARPVDRVDDRHQVRRPGVLAVGKPRHPPPGRMGGQQPEVVGSVEGGELADDGAGQGPGPVPGAGEGEDAGLAERDHHRGVGEAGRAADEPLRRRQELRVVLDQRVGGAVEPDRGGQGGRAAAHPDGEEVGVGRAAFPEPVGPLDRRPQQRRVGMEVLGHGELGRGQVVGPARGLIEVAEVAGPFPAPRPAGRPPLDEAEGEAGQQRGDGRPGHQGDQPARARARDREQERDRPSAAGQRHQVLEPAGQAGGVPADRRRGRDRQPTRRRRPRVGPHRPVHHDPAGPGIAPGRSSCA
jgi:hypothetical protein